MEDQPIEKKSFFKNKKVIKGGIIAVCVFIILAIARAVIGWPVSEIFSFLKNGDTSPKYVAVVMSKTDGAFTIPQEFLTGFGGRTSIGNSKLQNISVKNKEDLYSVEQAQKVADELVNDPNCILIIGNSNSQLTEVTLNSILKSTNRVSIILPIATADNLIEKTKSENFYAILRMVPDNEDQAIQIKSFIAKNTKNQKIAILVDEDNPTYSNNLSANICSMVRDNAGQILFQKIYGNSNRLAANIPDWQKYETTPEMIVFVGVSSNGLLLIDEMIALKLNIPVLFTDGCTVEELMNRAQNLQGPAYFVSAVTVTGSAKPTYTPIGADAYTIAERIINGVNKNITRETVRNYIVDKKSEIILQGGEAGNYRFNHEGNNEEMHFKIYTYDKGKLKRVLGF